MTAVTQDTKGVTLSECTQIQWILRCYFDTVSERKRGAVPDVISGDSGSVLTDCVGEEAQTTSYMGHQS